jgi:hypothetical protein
MWIVSRAHNTGDYLTGGPHLERTRGSCRRAGCGATCTHPSIRPSVRPSRSLQEVPAQRRTTQPRAPYWHCPCPQVERAKKCLDFASTVYLLHLFFVWGAGGSFPLSLVWWGTNVGGLLLMALLGEWLCVRREMADIPLCEYLGAGESGEGLASRLSVIAHPCMCAARVRAARPPTTRSVQMGPSRADSRSGRAVCRTHPDTHPPTHSACVRAQPACAGAAGATPVRRARRRQCRPVVPPAWRAQGPGHRLQTNVARRASGAGTPSGIPSSWRWGSCL